jgi:hypothetical protein
MSNQLRKNRLKSNILSNAAKSVLNNSSFDLKRPTRHDRGRKMDISSYLNEIESAKIVKPYFGELSKSEK